MTEVYVIRNDRGKYYYGVSYDYFTNGEIIWRKSIYNTTKYTSYKLAMEELIIQYENDISIGSVEIVKFYDFN